MSEWEEARARLENEIALWPTGEHEGWDGFVLDIRAALQRVEELERMCCQCEGDCCNQQAIQRKRAEAAEARVEELEREKTEIIGIVQRWQPAGSPPPISSQMLVRWICQTLEARAKAAEKRVEELEREKDQLRDHFRACEKRYQEQAETAEHELADTKKHLNYYMGRTAQAEAKLARVVGTLKQIAGDGCGMCTKKDEPCHKLFVREDDWCWCCIARKALDDLAAAKGE